MVRTVLVQPLHYQDSERLVRIYQPEWLYLPAPYILHVREHALHHLDLERAHGHRDGQR